MYLFSGRPMYISVHSVAKETVLTPHPISWRTTTGHIYLIWKRRPSGIRCPLKLVMSSEIVVGLPWWRYDLSRRNVFNNQHGATDQNTLHQQFQILHFTFFRSKQNTRLRVTQQVCVEWRWEQRILRSVERSEHLQSVCYENWSTEVRTSESN